MMKATARETPFARKVKVIGVAELTGPLTLTVLEPIWGPL
jgi:hypothetical protein